MRRWSPRRAEGVGRSSGGYRGPGSQTFSSGKLAPGITIGRGVGGPPGRIQTDALEVMSPLLCSLSYQGGGVVPRVGVEPTSLCLKGRCSTVELPRRWQRRRGSNPLVNCLKGSPLDRFAFSSIGVPNWC